jgi:hypothetical protein
MLFYLFYDVISCHCHSADYLHEAKIINFIEKGALIVKNNINYFQICSKIDRKSVDALYSFFKYFLKSICQANENIGKFPNIQK